MSRSGETHSPWLMRNGLFGVLMLLGLYLGLILVPEWWPAFGGTEGFFLYMLSLPVALSGLVGLAAWGAVGAMVARRRGLPMSKRHRMFVVVPMGAFLMFGCAMVLAQSIQGALPTGSHTLEFAPDVWQEPSSLEVVPGEITARQKMLGSLVSRFSVAQTRADLEALLGTSLETPYFKSTGRDLIYVLGWERDSFIRIDSEWLLIWLDDSGHFNRYKIAVD